MNMKQELRELKEKRRQEVRILHATYLRTKWDVRRAVSPDRMIRKHLGASLGMAAVLGLLIAPRLGGHKKKDGGVWATLAKWLRVMMRKIMPGSGRFMPEAEEMEEEGREDEKEPRMATEENHNGHEEPRRSRKRSKGLLATVLTEVVMVLLSRIDVPKLVAELVRGISGRGQRVGGDGHEPRVTVADAGAVREDPFGDLE
jgi:hypothetical protein